MLQPSLSSLVQLFSAGWVSRVIPLCPWPQAALLLAIPSLLSLQTSVLLLEVGVLTSGEVAPICPPYLLSFPSHFSVLASPPLVFPLLLPSRWPGSPQGSSFPCWFPSEIKRAESVPVSAEQWVMESGSVSWERSSEGI